MRKIPTFLILSLTLGLSVQARIWTDARNAQWQFEAEVDAINGEIAELKLNNGRNVALPIGALVDADQKYLASDEVKKALEAKVLAAAKAAEVTALALAEPKADEAKKGAKKPEEKKPDEKKPEEPKKAAEANPVAESLKGKLVKLEGDALKPTAFEAGKEPKFFLIYFSAKW